MKKRIWLRVLVGGMLTGFWSTVTYGAQLAQLHFYTANYPPANFQHQQQVTGYAVDLLYAAAKEVGQTLEPSQFTLQPWARSYRTTLTDENSVLFSTTRTPHRESLFTWVGPIHPIKVVVLARKDAKIEINNPLEMAKYRIGVIRDDVGEQSLLALGLPRESFQEATSVVMLAEQLQKKRIDLLAYDETAALWWASQSGIDPESFESVYLLKQGQLYYAFNKQTDAALLELLQSGLDQLKREEDENGMTKYQRIIEQYW